MNTTPTWMTTQEAAEYTRLDVETVRILMRRKEIRAVKVGRCYRTRTDWCDRYLIGESV